MKRSKNVKHYIEKVFITSLGITGTVIDKVSRRTLVELPNKLSVWVADHDTDVVV